MAIPYHMATMTIRATYALDPQTVRTLDHLAREWSVSKSEALRRAIRAAGSSRGANTALDALDALQASARLANADANRWIAEVRTERRRAFGRRMLRQR
jgi:predicted transcriptional regulator